MKKALILSLSTLLIFNLTSCKEKANQDISIYLKGEEVAKIKDGKDKNESQLPTLMEKKEI